MWQLQTPDNQVKNCTRCKQTKTLDNFRMRGDNRSRLNSWCRRCETKAKEIKRRAGLEKRRHTRIPETIVPRVTQWCRYCEQTGPVELFAISSRGRYKRAHKACLARAKFLERHGMDAEYIPMAQRATRTKRCNECRQELPLKQFYLDFARNEYRSACKDCTIRKRRELRESKKNIAPSVQVEVQKPREEPAATVDVINAPKMCSKCGIAPGFGPAVLCVDCLDDHRAHEHAQNMKKTLRSTYFSSYKCTCSTPGHGHEGKCDKQMTGPGRCYRCSRGRERQIIRAEECVAA